MTTGPAPALDAPLLIGGRRLAAHGDDSFPRSNPFTREVATVAAAASRADAEHAADNAADAAKAWAATPPSARRQALLETVGVLGSARERLVRLMVAEAGATVRWANANVDFAAGILLEAASQAFNLKGEIFESGSPTTLSLGMRVPAGVALSIAPWNAPLILAMRAIAFPLALGNAVVLKASELCPATHVLLGEIFSQAGLPDGVVNVVTHRREDAPAIVDALIAHRAIRHVNFTGSTAVGRVIGELCGRHLKPSLLELGGKNPLIVLADADVEYAAQAATFGAFINSGQGCLASNRIIVERRVADTFLEALAAQVRTLKVGDPNDEATDIGPLATGEAFLHVRELVDDALARGAHAVLAGEVDGQLVAPTVLSGVEPTMSIFYDEIFGPVAPVTIVDSPAAAVACANDTTYGLSAGIVTGDIEAGLAIAEQLETGMVHVNDQTVADAPQIPFGGVKDSGYGRFGGAAAIEQFTVQRWVTVERKPRRFGAHGGSVTHDG
jgi:acyl-CoA reductase-like NAD-dependent aldehyde dehydrogenase